MSSPPPVAADAARLALEVEIAELRQQLAAAQDLLMETAIDAGNLHAHNEALQAELLEARVLRDAWRAEALRRGRAVA